MSQVKGFFCLLISRLFITAKFMSLMVPLLLIGGKAFGFYYGESNKDIRNAFYSAKVDCNDGIPSLSSDPNFFAKLGMNEFFCTAYGKITAIGNMTTMPGSGMGAFFPITFQPYVINVDSGGNTVETATGNAKTYIVGLDTKKYNVNSAEATELGSGMWVWQYLSQVKSILTDAYNVGKVGALTLRLNNYDTGPDGLPRFYVQASSANSNLFPWGSPDSVNVLVPESSSYHQIPDANVWRTFSKRFTGYGRTVSVKHLWDNGAKTVDVNKSTQTIYKAEHIKARRYYQTSSFPSGWVTVGYEVEDIKTGTKTYPTTKPINYVVEGDDTLITGSKCTSSSPCVTGGVIAITVMNPQTWATDVYYVSSKKFSKEQLDAIDDPENAKLPCPFAAYAIEGGKQMLKTALNNNWKFKFNYVDGTNVTMNNGTAILGNFSGKKWIIGKAYSRESSFHESAATQHASGEREIEDDYDVISETDEAIMALIDDFNFLNGVGTGGHVDYNEVYCSCLEVYF